MGLRRLLMLGVLVGCSASVAVANSTGSDNVLKMGGGGGSPPCIAAGNFSFQGFVTGAGNIDNGTIGSPTSCNNNGTIDIRQWSFDIAAGAVLNPPLNVILDNLLAPFGPSNPLSFLDWTATCVAGATVDVCTASISDASSDLWEECPLFFGPTLCSVGSTLTATEMKKDFPWLFTEFGGDPCKDPNVYIIFGIIPGCDLSALSDSSVGSTGGGFIGGAPFDLAPAGVTPSALPEPSSLYMMLAGLAGLPLLRRKLIRS
jgi:hypothetical protein